MKRRKKGYRRYVSGRKGRKKVRVAALGVLCLSCAALLMNCRKAAEEGSGDKGDEAQALVIDTADEDEEAAREVQEALDELDDDLAELTGNADGIWSIYIKDLLTGSVLSVNSQPLYAASLIKLFVMESCYEHMDLILENDSAYSGSTEESSSKVDELLTNMITVSDNESYNELVRMHSASRSFTEGCTVVEEYIEESVYRNTGIFHTLSPSSTPSQATEDTSNYTCVEDCGTLLEAVYEGTCVSESASEAMLELLRGQQSTSKIPAGVPGGVETANKTGETDEVQHDAAIVFGEKTDYILCVMSEDIVDSEAAVSTIQEISAMVYECLN